MAKQKNIVHRVQITEENESITHQTLEEYDCRQISETIEDNYGFETSQSIASNVIDKILPQSEDLWN